MSDKLRWSDAEVKKIAASAFPHVQYRVICAGCLEDVTGKTPREHDCSLSELRRTFR